MEGEPEEVGTEAKAAEMEAMEVALQDDEEVGKTKVVVQQDEKTFGHNSVSRLPVSVQVESLKEV